MQETYPEQYSNLPTSNLDNLISSITIPDRMGGSKGGSKDLGGTHEESRGGMRKQKSITARTIRRWLRRNGYNYTDVRKVVYNDGHEREDVVASREQFVKTLEPLWPFVVEFEDD